MKRRIAVIAIMAGTISVVNAGTLSSGGVSSGVQTAAACYITNVSSKAVQVYSLTIYSETSNGSPINKILDTCSSKYGYSLPPLQTCSIAVNSSAPEGSFFCTANFYGNAAAMRGTMDVRDDVKVLQQTPLR